MNFIFINILKKFQLSFFLVCLIPFFLVTGPFFSDLSLLILVLIFIYYCVKNKTFFFIYEKFIKLFALFFIILLFSTILSDNILHSLKKTLTYLRFIFFCLAILFVINTNSNFLSFFSKFFIFIYLVVVFDGYFQFIFGFNTLGYVSTNELRLGGFFNDELILGSYLSRFLPLLVFCMFYLEIKNILILLTIFFTTILIFLTGERVSFLLSILTNIYFIIQIKSFRFNGFLFLIGIILISFISYISIPKINKRVNQTLGELGISNNYKPGYQIGVLKIEDKKKKIFKEFNFFSPMHENYLFTSIRMFKERPFLGHGPNTYRIKCSSKNYKLDVLSCSTHPHNTYVQLLAEIGLLGSLYVFLFFLYFLFISVRHFIYATILSTNKKYILSNYEICLIASFLITLFPFIPSGNFFNNWLSIIYFFPIAFYLSIKYWNKEKLIQNTL